MDIRDAVAEVILRAILRAPEKFPEELVTAARAYQKSKPSINLRKRGKRSKVWDKHFLPALARCLETLPALLEDENP
jgi:hypothetical protein